MHEVGLYRTGRQTSTANWTAKNKIESIRESSMTNPPLSIGGFAIFGTYRDFRILHLNSKLGILAKYGVLSNTVDDSRGACNRPPLNP